MKRTLRCLLAMLIVTAPFAAVTGCHEPERRKVTVVEEEEQGEVREVSPGEMIVE